MSGRSRILTAFIAGALLQFGCNSGSNPAADAKVSEAKDKIKEAAKATAEAFEAKRVEYAKEMGKQLAELQVKYDELKEKASKATGEEKVALEKKLEEAKAKHGDALKKLDDLKAASADRWEKLKEGMGNAYKDLKKVIE
jgi:hypothetical protein